MFNNKSAIKIMHRAVCMVYLMAFTSAVLFMSMFFAPSSEGAQGQSQGRKMNSRYEQVAAFLNEDGAIRMMKKLSQKGEKAFVKVKRISGRTYYAVMVVSLDKHPHVAFEAAEKFADFLLSAQAQKIIASFGVEKFGQPLFFRIRSQQKTERNKKNHE